MTATNRHIPGKRIKTWHRVHRKESGTMSLRAFARFLISPAGTDEQRDTATKWAGEKVAQ